MTLPDADIEIEGNLTIADAKAADRLSGTGRYHSRRFSEVVFLLLICCCILVLAYAYGVLTIFAFAALGLAISGCIVSQHILSARRRRVRDQWDCDHKLRSFRKVNGRATVDGIHLWTKTEHEDHTRFLSWHMFSGYRSNGSVVLLFYDFPWLYIAFSRGMFRNGEDWESFLSLVSSKLMRQ